MKDLQVTELLAIRLEGIQGNNIGTYVFVDDVNGRLGFASIASPFYLSVKQEEQLLGVLSLRKKGRIMRVWRNWYPRET